MDLSIRERLGIGFGTIFVLVAVGLGISLVQTARLDGLERRRTQQVAPARELVNDVMRKYLVEAIALRTHALDESAPAHSRWVATSEAARLARTRLEALPLLPASRALADKVQVLAEDYEQQARAFAELIDAHAAARTLETDELRLDGVRERLLDELRDLDDAQLAATAAAEDDAARARARIVGALVLVALLALGIGGVSALLTTKAVRDPTERLLTASRALARGDFAAARALGAGGRRAHRRDELRELAASFGDMARALERREAQITASAEVAQQLSATIDPGRIAAGALEVLTRWSGLPVGVVYLAKDARLVPIARHAIGRDVGSVALHEGVVGEAAASGNTLVARDLPGDTPYRLHVGVDEVRPRVVIAVPMRLPHELVGVLLLAGVAAVDAETIAAIEQAAQHLAISLRNALTHVEVKRLAGELEERNGELRAHVEEVQAQNEEIRAQNEEIQTRNEEIQALSEEIRAQNEALQRQNETLAETDRQKDELISVASHELRTPLTALTIATQLMERHCDAAVPVTSLKNDAERISRQVGRLSDHVERLLDFSRARMGRLELKRAPTDVAAILRELVAELSPRTPERKLILELANEGLVGEWDRSYLEQVFTNLIENALRYSPNGEDVDVRAAVVNGEVRVSVRDRGIGIAPDAMAQLFEPYFRDAEARRISRVGLGIGLYVTRQIVAAHGGRVWADSTPGCGSTFTVALPLLPAEPLALPHRLTDGQAAAHS